MTALNLSRWFEPGQTVLNVRSFGLGAKMASHSLYNKTLTCRKHYIKFCWFCGDGKASNK